MTKYDVIIVGAGVGGLICGNFLAKYGKKVLIIEQHDRPGGCVTAIKRKDCVFDMGGHLFGSCNEHGILSECLSRLNIKVNFARINPSDQFHFNQDVVKVPSDADEYIELLIGMFPEEALNIKIFFKQIFYLARNFSNNDIIKKFSTLTYQDLLNTYFKNNQLKGILSAQYLYIGQKPNKSSALFMAVLMASYLKDGVYYSLGGTQVFSDAVYKKFIDYGGACFFKRRVEKILINRTSRVALGVKLRGDDEILADVIISNADARSTIFDLIGVDNFPSQYINRVAGYQEGPSLFLTFLAINDYKKDLSGHRGWHFSSYDMNGNNNPLYISIPTLFDSSIAPTGTHILEILTESPYEFTNVKNWDKCKRVMQDSIFEKVEALLGPIKEHLLYVDSASPRTMERYTLNRKGSVYGWAMTPAQTAVNRLQQETPLNNFYFVGHWTTPGCGITSVAVSGWSLAKKICDKNN